LQQSLLWANERTRSRGRALRAALSKRRVIAPID